MTARGHVAPPSHGNIWIISDAKYTDPDETSISRWLEADARPIMYEISGLAKYILSPYPVEFDKTLVGCRLYYRRPLLAALQDRFARLLRRSGKNDHPLCETMTVDSDRMLPRLEDSRLESYVTQVHALLRHEEPILKKLSLLDTARLSDIKGVCEGIGGNRTELNLNGSINDKMNYLQTYLCQAVAVILDRPQLSDGLFDMRGFDFRSFNPNTRHVLLSYASEGQQKCCVLDRDCKPEFFVPDVKHIGYLRLLQKSVSINRDFSEAIALCVQDKAQPHKLFFYHQLKIDYSKTHCPEAYREVLEDVMMSANEKELIIKSLNNAQFGISFSYVPRTDNSKEKPITTISVMHDIRALQPIREGLPHLYARISSKISDSGVGNFYFLDSIKGCAHD